MLISGRKTKSPPPYTLVKQGAEATRASRSLSSSIAYGEYFCPSMKLVKDSTDLSERTNFKSDSCKAFKLTSSLSIQFKASSERLTENLALSERNLIAYPKRKSPMIGTPAYSYAIDNVLAYKYPNAFLEFGFPLLVEAQPYLRSARGTSLTNLYLPFTRQGLEEQNPSSSNY